MNKTRFKTKTWLRVCSLFLTVIMLVGLFPMTALATNENGGGGLDPAPGGSGGGGDSTGFYGGWSRITIVRSAAGVKKDDSRTYTDRLMSDDYDYEEIIIDIAPRACYHPDNMTGNNSHKMSAYSAFDYARNQSLRSQNNLKSYTTSLIGGDGEETPKLWSVNFTDGNPNSKASHYIIEGVIGDGIRSQTRGPGLLSGWGTWLSTGFIAPTADAYQSYAEFLAGPNAVTDYHDYLTHGSDKGLQRGQLDIAVEHALTDPNGFFRIIGPYIANGSIKLGGGNKTASSQFHADSDGNDINGVAKFSGFEFPLAYFSSCTDFSYFITIETGACYITGSGDEFRTLRDGIAAGKGASDYEKRYYAPSDSLAAVDFDPTDPNGLEMMIVDDGAPLWIGTSNKRSDPWTTGSGMWFMQGFSGLSSTWGGGGLSITKYYGGNEKGYNGNALYPTGNLIMNNDIEITVDFADGVTPAGGSWPATLDIEYSGNGGVDVKWAALQSQGNGVYSGTITNADINANTSGQHGYMWTGDTISAKYNVAKPGNDFPTTETTWGNFYAPEAVCNGNVPFAAVTVEEKGFDSDGYQSEAAGPNLAMRGTRVVYEGTGVTVNSGSKNVAHVDLMANGTAVTITDVHEAIRIQKEVVSNFTDESIDFTKDDSTEKVSIGSGGVQWGSGTFGTYQLVLSKKNTSESWSTLLPKLYITAEKVSDGYDDAPGDTGAYVQVGTTPGSFSSYVAIPMTNGNGQDESAWKIYSAAAGSYSDSQSEICLQFIIREGYRVTVTGLPESGLNGGLNEWWYSNKWTETSAGSGVYTRSSTAENDLSWEDYIAGAPAEIRGVMIVDEASFAAHGTSGNLPKRSVQTETDDGNPTFVVNGEGSLDNKFSVSALYQDYELSGADVVKSSKAFQERKPTSARHPIPVDQSTPDLFVFTNIYGSKETVNGNCHLVIDLNMNGKPLYELNGMRLPDGTEVAVSNSTFDGTSLYVVTDDGHLIDCGSLPADAKITNLADLVAGIGNVTFNTNIKVTNNATGNTFTRPVQIVAKPTGLYTAATGGTKITGDYTLKHTDPLQKDTDHLHVLFVQWEFEISDVEIDDGSSTPPGPGSHVDITKTKVVPLYWDLGYYGAGLAASEAGFSITHGERNVFTYYTDAEGNTYGPYETHVDLAPLVATWYIESPYGLNYEERSGGFGNFWHYAPERVGWTFLGWVDADVNYKTWTDTSTGYTADARALLLNGQLNSRYKLQQLGVINDNTAASYLQWNQINYFNDCQFLKDDFDTAINTIYQTGDENALNSLTSHTYRALWISDPIIWHSMGGKFYSRSMESGVSSLIPSKQFSPTADDPRGLTASHVNWAGDTHSRNDGCETFITNGYQTSERNYIPVPDYPIRPGYVFQGWYYDPYCSIPLNEYETGIQPGRSYFAGWAAEDIVVNYYDTREGTHFIGSQTVKYGDVVKLMDRVQDTSGWSYVGWTTDDGTSVNGTNKVWTLDSFLAEVDPDRYLANGNNSSDSSVAIYEYHNYQISGPMYTEVYNNEGRWEVNLYADYDIHTTSYTVEIHWDDFSDNDGCRPQSVTVGLVSSVGNTVIKTATLTSADEKAANLWAYTFTDLPITVSDSNTDVVNYSFCFLSYVDCNGNGAELQDTNASSGEILVTTPTTTSTDATSSYSYAVSLYQNPTTGGGAYNPPSAHGGFALGTLFSDLAGKLFGSSDDVKPYDNGHNQPDTDHTFLAYGGVLYMTHTLILTGDDISFTVVWDDDSNRDGARPESIMLTLYAKVGNGSFEPVYIGTTTNPGDSTAAHANGSIYVSDGMCEVSADGNSWTYTFEDYQKYANNGQVVTYAVSIGTVPQYSVEYLDSNPDTNGAILHYTPKQAPVNETLYWHDNNNQDGVRPDSVTVGLIAAIWDPNTNAYASSQIASKTISVGGANSATAASWSVSFGNQFVYANGKPIIYHMEILSDLNAKEENAYRWTEGIYGNNTPTAGITLTADAYHNTDVKDVVATIEWDDNLNQDGYRPEGLVIQLYADGVAVPGEEYHVTVTGGSEALTWTHTFHDVPIFKSGSSNDEVTYSIRVLNPIGGYNYSTEYSESFIGNNGAKVMNPAQSVEPYILISHNPETATVNAKIYWNDELNRDGERAASVTVALMAHAFDPVTHAYEDTIVGTKVLTDNATAATWSTSFANMPVYSSGRPIIYYLVVQSDLNANVGPTAPQYGWAERDRGDNTAHDLEVSVTVSQNTEVKDVLATIEWADNYNQDEYRPESVTIQLYADNVAVEGEDYTVVVTGDSDALMWYHTFYNLPRYRADQSGEEIVYTIRIISSNGGDLDGEYTLSYIDANGAYVSGAASSAEPYILASHLGEVGDVKGVIYWNDELNRDGERADYVDVALMAHALDPRTGEYTDKVVRTVRMTGDPVADKWTTTFEDMPVYSGGELITYYLVVQSELNANIGPTAMPYSWAEKARGENPDPHTLEVSVTISQNTEVKDVVATVEWADEGNKDNYRPDSIVIQLYADNQPVEGEDYTVTLTGDSRALTWEYTFHNVPRYKAGTTDDELTYTIRVLTGNSADFEQRYVRSYVDDAGQKTMNANDSAEAYVLLTHEEEFGDVKAVIYWNDELDRDGERADDVTVALMAHAFDPVNNVWTDSIVRTAVMDGDHDAATWEMTFAHLPVYSGERLITYYLVVTSDLNANIGPTAKLYGWTEKARGENPEPHTLEVSVIISQNTEVRDVVATVEWADTRNQDGYRPDSVVIQLYADGVPVDRHGERITDATTNDGEAYTVTLTGDSEDPIWTYTFENVPRYRSDGSGDEITYTIKIVESMGGRLDEDYVQWYIDDEGQETTVFEDSAEAYIKPYHVPEVGDVAVRIVWDDELNRDGERTDYVKVALMAHSFDPTTHTYTDSVVGTKILEYPANEENGTSNNTDSDWTDVFPAMPVYSGGRMITYYLVVTSDLNAHIGPDAQPYGWTELERGENDPDFDNPSGTPGQYVYPHDLEVSVIISQNLEVQDIVATIEWDDDNNNDGIRPTTVILQLYADGQALTSNGEILGLDPGDPATIEGERYAVVLSGDMKADTWTYVFRNVPRYSGEGDHTSDNEITYTIKVIEINEGEVYGTYDIMGQSGEHHIYPMYDDWYITGTNDTTGNTMTGIYSSDFVDSTEAFVRLSHANDLVHVPIALDWHDNNNQDGLRPESVEVELLAYRWSDELGDWETVSLGKHTVRGDMKIDRWNDSFGMKEVFHDGQPVIYRLKVTSDLNGNIDDYSNGYTWSEGIIGNPCIDSVTPTIDLYHNLDERSVVATVQWDDDFNNDEYRPDSVILQLYANGEKVPGEDYRVLLTGDMKAATWTWTFENLDIYTPGQVGHEVVYTIQVENAHTGSDDEGNFLDNYTPWYINANDKFVRAFTASTEAYVRLTYVQKVNNIDGTIYWQDELNRDGERPEFVDVDLMAHVYDDATGSYMDYVAATKHVGTDGTNHMTADKWTFVFEDMPIYRDGQLITYYLVVKSDLNGNISETAKPYGWAEKYRGNNYHRDLEVAVTIYQGLEIKDVTAVVEWDDDHNNDNLRPSSVTLQLFADGVRVEGEQYTVTLTGDMTANEWTYTFENLPRYEDGDSGDEITYTIYIAEIHEGELYGTYDEVAVNGDSYTFRRYQDYYNTGIDGVYSTDLADSVESFVRLTHETNEIEVPISIIWQDENNRDGQRPEYVTVQLMAYQWNDSLYTWEYKEYATKTIRANEIPENTMTASEWTETFGLRPEYHDGAKIIYHLHVISDLNEYLPEGSFEYGWVESAWGNQLDAIPQVIISQNTNTVSVPTTIYWDDSQNNDNIRPKNIIVQLYAHEPDGTPVPVEGQAYRINLTGDMTADNWNYTFTNVPKYVSGMSGVELIYTAQVIEVDGEPLYGKYIITANGEEEEVVRYTATYLKESIDLGDGVTVETSDPNESDRAYVKLTHITETKTMNFSVNWHDDDNRDGIRPYSVPVDMFKTVGNGEPIFLKTLVITENSAGTWTFKVTDLPGYENGQPVKYSIEVPEDVKAQFAAIEYTTTTQDNIVHMYYTPKTGDISTVLYWSDEGDNDGIRPDSVIATLYANGVSTGYTIDLNETNNWSGTWTNLNVHYVKNAQTGLDIVYSVQIESPAGYAVTYNPESTTIEENEILYIQVAHTMNVIDVPVTVYWNDNSNNDGKRPDSLRVMLLVDGANSVYETTLTVDNAIGGNTNIWGYTFENMPMLRDNGQRIYYSVKVYDDATVNGQYSSLTAGTNLYLAHNARMSEMYVSFQFNDNHNADGKRMTGLYLQLTADGVPVDTSEYKHTVSFDTNVDGFRWDFGELPVYKVNGQKIKYNVIVTFDEEFGATDYSIWTSRDIELSESSGAATNQIIVKLSRNSDTSGKTGSIYWFDCNDMFGNRPDFLVISLQNNYSDTRVSYRVDAATGKVTNMVSGAEVGTVSVEEWTGDASVWNYTIDNLPQNYINNAGESAPIYYYITANTTAIAEYYPKVVTGVDFGMNASLTHRYYEENCAASSQAYSITIMWLDNSNAWGYRPDSAGVKVDLMANDDVYDTLFLTSANAIDGNDNAWTYKFDSLPTFRNGNAVVWSVRPADVASYTKVQTIGTATASSFTYFQSVGFNFTAIWNDDSNDDGVRPDAIDLGIYADGTQVGSVNFTNPAAGESDVWTASIKDLPVWRESDADAAVQYTFRWNADTAAEMRDADYTAGPTMHGQPVEATTFYALSNSEFGNNEDAGYNVLTSTYEWETTLSHNREIADYYFDVTVFDDFDRDGIRPTSIVIDLLADGVKVSDQTLEVSVDTDVYSIVWKDMNVKEDGENIVYTIDIAEVPDGYTAEYNEEKTAVTLTHEVELVDVTGTMIWDDSTGLVDVYNAEGTYVRSYEHIDRADVYLQLKADGEAYGNFVLLAKSEYGEGENLARSLTYTWPGLYKYRDHGTAIEYTMVASSGQLTDLLDDGYSMVYDFSDPYALSATVTHDLYDIRGTVYYMYSYNDDFLLAGVPVTAYLHDETSGEYRAAQTTMTKDDGTFEFLNLQQGSYIIRATYSYGGNPMAGTEGVILSLKDAETTVIVNRSAANDSDSYLYTAQGTAFYQTDDTDDSTIHTVPEDSVVLLFKVIDGQSEPQYITMTTTDANGRYSFGGLDGASYFVNVVFKYDGGVYTYDNADAIADGISFTIAGADVQWPDIIKSVNKGILPIDPVVDPIIPDEPDEPIPCVVSGSVFYEDNGVHSTDPVEGVDVYVYIKSSNVEVGHTVTDENGFWEVEGLAPDDYIAVFSNQGSASRVWVFTVSPMDYERGTKDAAPQYFDREYVAQTGTIKGIVLNENGEPVRALVTVFDENGDPSDFRYTDSYGFYEFTVASGYDYHVRILEVVNTVTELSAGDPDDALTEVSYYTLSGIFGVDGVPQSGALVAVYYQNPATGAYSLVTATLTGDDGRFTAVVTEEGNYRVCPYISSEIYETRNVSVGYEEERPAITRAVNGSYTLDGTDNYQDLALYFISMGVEDLVASQTGINASSYHIENLNAGQYRLELTNNGEKTVYYFTAPENTLVEVAYFVNIEGSVINSYGEPIVGANVAVYDANGNKVGADTTILSDGGYHYNNLPEGDYTVVITAPNTSGVLLDRWTHEEDSYGNAYPNGLEANKAWIWNINAHYITGSVLDQNGEPFEHAMVMFTNEDDLESQFVVYTDADGIYTIGLAPAQYSVRASYAWDINHIFPAPGVVYIDVTGDADGQNFVIPRNDLTILTRRTADGMIAPDARVLVYFDDGTLYIETRTDEEGAVTVPVFPGEYLIRAEFDGARSVTANVAVSGDKTVTLTINSKVYLTGTVTGEDGQPAGDAIVYYNGGGTSGHVYTEDDGTFTIELSSNNLGEFEVYAVRGTAQGETVTVNVTEDVDIELTVPAEGSGENETHTISGVVTDEEGNRLANALVTMTMGNDKVNQTVTSTNSMGEYSFEVEDGTYYLFAEYEASNGNTYASNADYAVHVNGSDVDRDLVVLMRYNVDVYVVSMDTTPVAGATVFFSGAESGTAVTGEDGHVILDLAKGEYTFYAKTTSRTSLNVRATVAGETEVVIQLVDVYIVYEEPIVEHHDLTIYGWAVAMDGTYVPDAEITLWQRDLETLEWFVKDTAITGADGYYEFPGLEEGLYRVDTVYAVTLDAPAEPANYAVIGDLTDEYGNPLSGVTVELYDGEDLIETVVTDEDGHYQLDVSDPEIEYTVKAVDAIGNEVLNDPATAEPTAVVISGVFQDLGGNILSDAQIVLKDEDGNIVATTLTDDTGFYSVAVNGYSPSYTAECVYPVSYEVDTPTYVRDATDPAAPYLTDDSYSIEGLVHDSDGNLVEGAVVTLKDATGEIVDSMITGEDGAYAFYDLQPGRYTVEVSYNDDIKQVYGIETDTGEVTDLTPEEAAEYINVGVENYTRANLVEPADGWVKGENVFTVDYDHACLVVLERADGSSERLTSVEEDGVRKFVADFEEGDKLVLVMFGDMDMDGRITASDVADLNCLMVSLYDGKYAIWLGDMDKDGRVTASDVADLNMSMVSMFETAWDEE